MLAIAAGVVCGVCEYLLLMRLTRSLLSGVLARSAALMAAKFAVLAITLALVYICDYSHILWAGAAIAVTMALLALVVSIIGHMSAHGRRKAGV